MITTPLGSPYGEPEEGTQSTLAGHGPCCLEQTGSVCRRTGEQTVPAFRRTNSHRSTSHPRLSDRETVVLGIIVLRILVRTSLVLTEKLQMTGSAGSLRLHPRGRQPAGMPRLVPGLGAPVFSGDSAQFGGCESGRM